ncbi:hypothetical protein Tco_1008116 [Tanacetum coccineum]
MLEAFSRLHLDLAIPIDNILWAESWVLLSFLLFQFHSSFRLHFLASPFLFRGSAGCEFLEQPEHFSHFIVDLLALLENVILKSFHSFDEGLSRLLRHKLEGCVLSSVWVSVMIPLVRTLMVVKGEVLNDFPGFVGILIAEFAAAGAFNLASKMKGDMIIKNLDLKPTINAMMRDFL